MGYIPLVLVVEDNEINRELILDILEDQGYRVNLAVNGKDGVEKALAEIPDLILMDVEMPVLNGLDATRILRDNPDTNRVPVIVLTGLNETEDRIKAFNCGAMDYLTKPFNALELIARVKSYIRFSLLNKKYVLSTISQETGLPNRAAFLERLPELTRPKLLLIKIDNIEAISRFYGESTGTDIEKNFTRFLMLREESNAHVKNGMFFHLGKGLFGYLWDDPDESIDKDTARSMGVELLKNFNSYKSTRKEAHYDIELTVIVGFDRENMLEKSELALEEAIRNRTGILMMDDIIKDVYQTIGENIFWLKKIKEAVQDNRIIPFYQPIFNGCTGKVDKFESLVRLIDEAGNVVPPIKFLFIAKNSKYYPDLTKQVTEKSFRMFKNRPEEFSINISALDIENKHIRDFLLESLKNDPDAAKRLTMEIVEQEGVKHFDILKDFVHQVKKYGVKIAIDDFGSGYSNFRSLLDMEVDFIKIDGSLIRNVHTDPSSHNVVETIKAFAEKNSIGIIAEFVENQEIFDCLKKMGICYFQGYYIGKPERL